MPLKIDLHIHTNYSYDSVITPEELVLYAKKRGLDGIAITDHDRLDGALKIAERADIFVIPGMEITSSEGHIVALDVENPVSKGLDAGETVDEIHRAGGLAVACHPATLYKGSLGMHTREKFDAVEVINASAFPFNLSVKRAKRLATELQASEVAGTDAHYGPEIGCAYTMIEAEQTVDGVMEAIRKGLCQPFGRAIPWRLRFERFFATRGG